tara:strand:- start:244 stop:1380 length:1137 start_codon:yes stop_codon:yes gene_type:complete
MISLLNTARRQAASGGGGGGILPFSIIIDTSKAAGDTFTLPINNDAAQDGTIDWGDSSTSDLSYANRTHTYASGGVYTISISGDVLKGFYFNNGGDKLKMIEVVSWGHMNLTSPSRAFFGCSNMLDVSATDYPTITASDVSYMFYNCSSLRTLDTSAWDMSSVTTYQSTLRNCPALVSGLEGFVTSTATNLHTCFFDTDYKGDLSSWDVSGVTGWNETFKGANTFNANMTGWAVQGNMSNSRLFDSNSTITGIGLDTWDVSNLTHFKAYNCANLNPDITGWTTPSLLAVRWQSCGSFDRSMANWDINQVTDFANFLLGAGISTANYDATLIAWDAQGTMAFSGTVNFGSSQYTSDGAADAARTSLISKWGGITDGGAA